MDLASGEDVGRYTKFIIEADAVKPINKLGSEMRREHYALTLPWYFRGCRVLPAAMYDTYVARIDKLIKKRKTAANKFLREYPSLKRKERARLGTLHKASDYPTVAQLRKQITSEYKLVPMPSATQFVVVGLSQRERTRIRVDIEKTVESTVALGARDLYGRLGKQIQVVSKQLGTKSDGKKNRVFGSSLDDLKEVAEFVPDLNLTDNSYLNEVSGVINHLLDGVTADSLRSNTRVRTRVKIELDRLNERFAVGFMLPRMP